MASEQPAAVHTGDGTNTDRASTIASSPAPAATHQQQQPPATNHQQPAATYQQPPGMYAYPQSMPPYVTYPVPLQPQEQAAGPQETKSWFVTKLILNIMSLICAICAIALVLSGVNTNSSAYGIVFIVPVAGLALIVSAVELIMRVFRKFKAGMHPVAHLVMSLLIWLGALVCAGFFAVFIIAYGDDNYCYQSYGYYYSDDYYGDCSSGSGSRRMIAVAAEVFLCLLFVIHLVIFIGACVDIHRRNSYKRHPVVVYHQVPPNWGMMPPAQPAQPYYAAPQSKEAGSEWQGQQPQGPSREVTGYYTPAPHAS